MKAAKKPKLLPRRRLKESDVNVVDQPMLKKALGGTIVGNTMEWYDVGVFGYLITTMGPVFLPESDPTTRNLFLLGTFAATFIARPLGGVVFGWLGDKVGRQKILAATLMIMAASTFAVGLLPGYAQIGLWAAALLVLLKVIQGFSTGGEYAGATTFVSEYAADKRRGFFASFLDLGSYMGFAIGAALVSVLQLTLGQDTMEEWGWRIPFLVGRSAGPDRGVLPEQDRGIPAVPGHPGRPGGKRQERQRTATPPLPRARWESSRPTGAPSSLPWWWWLQPTPPATH